MQQGHSNAGPVTVYDKVRAILSRDDSGNGFIGVADRRPRVEQLSEWERDLLTWGAVYGLAFGIARAENPFEETEDVAERAFEVAWLAWLDWSGEFSTETRDTRGIVQNVIREYNKLGRWPASDELQPLHDALIGLSNATGL